MSLQTFLEYLDGIKVSSPIIASTGAIDAGKMIATGDDGKIDISFIPSSLIGDSNTILNGTVDPTTEGADGDFYINTTTYLIFGPKTSGAWGAGTSLIGANGTNGTNGIDGLNGKSVLNGVVDPTTEGADGDFYLNTSSFNIFGPKTSGVWGSGTSLIGAPGADGTNGTNGLDGRTILSGTVDPTIEGSDGDFYINTATWYIFGPKTSGVWGSGTSLIGEPGADGTNGTNGIDGKTILNGVVDPTSEGVDGDFYINTATWYIFGPKTSGIWSSGTRIIGLDGANGTDGRTVLSGTSDPTAQGVDGDFYINTLNFTIFGPKTGGSWGSPTSLVGAKGDTGAPGTNGIDGINGTNGIDGKTILNGTVDPTSEGVDGDFYINTVSEFIFGPKTNGVWPTGISLVGPPGSTAWDALTGDVNFIPVDTTPEATSDAPGAIQWNDANGTIEVVNSFGEHSPIGQRVYGIGVNKSGSTLTAGSVVTASGVQGLRMAFAQADARDGNKCSHIGVLALDTINNAEAPVVTFGVVTKLNTSGLLAGTKLYVAADATGDLSATPPDYPNFRVWVATVIVEHATQGMIFVNPRLDYGDGVTLDTLFVRTSLSAPDVQTTNLSGAVIGTDPTVNTALEALDSAAVLAKTKEISYTLSGALSVKTSIRRYISSNIHVSKITASVSTPSSESAIVIDIKKNGASAAVIATPISIAASEYVSSTIDITTPGVSSGDYLQVDITQIGSVTAGADLVVTITFECI